VGWCTLKPVEVRVEIAWSQDLKLKSESMLLRCAFDLNLRHYTSAARRRRQRGTSATYRGYWPRRTASGANHRPSTFHLASNGANHRPPTLHLASHGANHQPSTIHPASHGANHQPPTLQLSSHGANHRPPSIHLSSRGAGHQCPALGLSSTSSRMTSVRISGSQLQSVSGQRQGVY